MGTAAPSGGERPSARQMAGDGSVGSRIVLEYIEEKAGHSAPEDLVVTFDEQSGVVILEGSPRDEHAREELVDIAAGIEGIEKVDDRMVILKPGGGARGGESSGSSR
jgi:osmotically-inducible protein OsmY